MFEKLVESSREKKSHRTGRYFAIACIAYSIALAVLCIGTVITFSPVLAEEYNLATLLAPPPPQGPAPLPAAPLQRAVAAQPAPGFVVPRKPPTDIPPATNVTPRVTAISDWNPNFAGMPSAWGTRNGVPGAMRSEEPAPPPPPAPKPTPKPESTPTPEKLQTQKVSEGVLQGKVLQRVKPAYPNIAKAIRASGSVQVQVTISETGRVIEAVVVSGHPTLRDAARDAARQWIFTPTTLSNIPVKVQGVLTFNFTLE